MRKLKRTPKPKSPAQRWAQQRNFAKFRLSGVVKQLRILRSDMILTPYEAGEHGFARVCLQQVLDNWDKNNETSKNEFLRK